MKTATRTRLLIIACLCIAFSSSAFGEGRVVSRAYEVSLDNFQPPQSDNGAATFKACDDCELLRVSVTTTTRYAVNGQSVELEAFRLALLQTYDRDAGSITVLHHLDSNRIEAVDAWL